MAKKKKTDAPGAAEPQKGIVVNQITIRAVDRMPKDIKKWRDYHQAAESVYYANRTYLYDMYDDIRLDGHLTGIIEKRIGTVLNRPLSFEVNGEVVEEMDELIKSIPFRKMMREIMETKFWGISGVEFIIGKKFDFNCIPRKHIKPQYKVISYEQSSTEGITYEDLPMVWVMGEQYDLGLLLKCCPYVIYKRNNLADWAQYVEIFGMPVRVIKYDANDVKTKVELQQVLDDSGSALAIMIPKQAEFEMKDGKQSNGDGKLQQSFNDSLNAEVSVIVLGNTQTTRSSSGSGDAQTKEHGKQQDEIIQNDLFDMKAMLNSEKFFNVLRSYGYAIPETGGKFVFEPIIDEYESAARMTIDKQFPAPLGDDYFYKYYGRPKPENYDELKAQQEAERLAKLNHMNSSGLASDNNGNADGTDNTDDSDGQQNDLQKKAGKKNANANLTQWQRFRASLADFFDHGHND
jgi:hypothetical protein